jgi:hypothetical protein
VAEFEIAGVLVSVYSRICVGHASCGSLLLLEISGHHLTQGISVSIHHRIAVQASGGQFLPTFEFLFAFLF